MNHTAIGKTPETNGTSTLDANGQVQPLSFTSVIYEKEINVFARQFSWEPDQMASLKFVRMHKNHRSQNQEKGGNLAMIA